MLRKSLHIALISLLLISTTGMTINIQYCGGKLVSASFSNKVKSCCGMHGCCENRSYHFEKGDNYIIPGNFEYQEEIGTDILLTVNSAPVLVTVPPVENVIGNYTDLSPPVQENTHLSFLQKYRC